MESLFLREERPPERRWLYWAEGALLITGILLISYVAWTYGFSQLDQSWANYSLNQELSGKEATFADYLGRLTGVTKEVPPPEPQASAPACPRPQVRLPVGATVGRIEIPRLNIAAIVREGADDKVLKRAVGRVTTTAMPGEDGNIGLAAHRDTLFRNLRDVRMGDLVRIITPSGTYEYKVDSLKIVKPDNVEVLNRTPKPAVTLVTCYPFNYIGSAPKRFIVRATQINAAAPVAQLKHKPEAKLQNASIIKRVRHTSKRRGR